MSPVQVIVDKRKLDALAVKFPNGVAGVIQKICQDTEADIKTNFNAVSPAPPGETPGVVTGNLKNSVLSEPDASNDQTWWLRIGAEYGAALEYGTMKMAARPFLLPALRRIPDRLPEGAIREIFE